VFLRLLAVARITFLESLRSKSLYTVLVVLALQIITLQLFDEYDTRTTIKGLQSVTHYGINLFVLLAGLILASSQIPRDIANRHLFFIFVKPLSKAEFLLGKILGIWGILFLMYLLTLLSLTLVLFFVPGEASEKVVTARSNSVSLTMEIDGELQGESLKITLPENWTKRSYALPDKIEGVKKLQWNVAQFKGERAHNNRYFLLIRGDKTQQVVLHPRPSEHEIEDEGHDHDDHRDHEDMLEARWLLGHHVEIDLPAAFSKKGCQLMPLGNRRKAPKNTMFVMRPGIEKMKWTGSKVGDSFAADGIRCAIDMRTAYPNTHYEIEVTLGEETVTQVLDAREIYYFDFKPLKMGPYPEMMVSLKSSSKTSYYLRGNRIWLEGKVYSLHVNMWRGLGITLLNIFIVTGMTLIVSVFLSSPTSMLLGFTLFLFAHSTEALQDLPKTLFQQAEKIENHAGHQHIGYSFEEDALGPQALGAAIETMEFCLPTFDRFSLPTYISRGEFVPMHIFWSELFSVLIYLVAWLGFGTMVISRKEFLK
jgi:hypothetical protein